MSLQGQRAGRDLAAVKFRGHAKRLQRSLHNRQQLMDPVVGLRLAEAKLQALHRLQWIRLEVDQDEQQAVFRLIQHTFAPAARLPLPHFPGPGELRRITALVGRLIGRQELLKFSDHQPGRCQEFTWLVFELLIGQHMANIHHDTLMPI